ncbi:MAG: DUF3307 domain-containing protein [Caldilineaceae bacterium]|nr:DUF3307 domain-containing protein [Caldilineaceae bacterium]
MRGYTRLSAIFDGGATIPCSRFGRGNATIVMSLFNWLLVGHLIADWMLQNDWMARNKLQQWLAPAIFVHCTIYTLTLLIMVWSWQPDHFVTPQSLLFGAGIFLSHWIIDAGNLAARWMQWLRQSRLPFVQIMVDQTMHVVIIALLAEWLL